MKEHLSELSARRERPVDDSDVASVRLESLARVEYVLLVEADDAVARVHVLEATGRLREPVQLRQSLVLLHLHTRASHT